MDAEPDPTASSRFNSQSAALLFLVAIGTGGLGLLFLVVLGAAAVAVLVNLPTFVPLP